MGLAVPLGLDREHAGLDWAAPLVLLVSEMSSLTPGTQLLPQRRSVIEFVLSRYTGKGGLGSTGE